MSGSDPSMNKIPCCPPMAPDDTCDVLDFHYRMNYPARVQAGVAPILVEVKLHFRFTRCPGPLALGNLVYTNTLLPGEKVKLFTSDRRTKFTYDTASQVSYRNTQSSEESAYAQQFSDSVMDTSARDSGNSSNQVKSHVDGHADAGVDLLGMGGSANMSGSFESNSLNAFLNEHSSHARASHHAAEQSTRKMNSVSVGEVQRRTHTSTQSEDHFESSSREFSNPNHCHAITFLFYQINKKQTVSYTLEAIDRRVVLDPRNDITKVALNPVSLSDGVGRTSINLLPTDPQARFNALGRNTGTVVLAQGPGVAQPNSEFVAIAARLAALKQVDKELQDAGLLGGDGKVAADAQKTFSFTVASSLPTAGILVKGCLDDCSVCEAEVEQELQLKLTRLDLENKMLERRIALLDRSEEFRPPSGPVAAPAPPPPS